jgi:hypothetical protein
VHTILVKYVFSNLATDTVNFDTFTALRFVFIHVLSR